MSVTSEGVAASKVAVDKALEVTVDYILPVGAILGGFLAGPALGGTQSIANMLYNGVPGGQGGVTDNRIAGLAMMAVWGGVAVAFWSVRKHGNIFVRALGSGAGGFFIGVSVSNLKYIIQGSAAGAGWLDKLAGDVSSAAQGEA